MMVYTIIVQLCCALLSVGPKMVFAMEMVPSLEFNGAQVLCSIKKKTQPLKPTSNHSCIDSCPSLKEFVYDSSLFSLKNKHNKGVD